jgi:uncharacterized coiled-coil DUF342 family protein
MTQALEKITANIYVLWSGIIFAAAGAWATCAVLGGISAQIVEVSHKVDTKNDEVSAQISEVAHKVDMTNAKVQSLGDTTDRNQEWIKAVSAKVDGATSALNAHDLVLQKQADQLDEMQRAINKDAAANRASQK